jgi:ribosomal protein S18 acetylase RimI-like enzyme
VSQSGAVTIRRATPDDAHAIAVIHVASSLAAYRGLLPDQHLEAFTVERREANWHGILTGGDGVAWIAEDGGRPLGWIHVGSSRDGDAAPTTAELRTMYIDPSEWRRGIGRALWAEAEAHLVAQDFKAVTLWVFQANARAIEFYRALGFREDPGHSIAHERAGVRIAEIRLRRDL